MWPHCGEQSVVCTLCANKHRAALPVTYVMQVEAFWIVACNALQKGIAILGGAEACLHLLACRKQKAA